MLDEFTNMLFWDILHTSLLVANNPSSRIHKLLNNNFELIPKDILDIYIKIAEVGNDFGLPYNYFDYGGSDGDILNNIITDTNRTSEEVIDYYVPILRLFAASL